jgi:ABC-type Fe3+/spermidine/putrescine transport system ATPase subunit
MRGLANGSPAPGDRLTLTIRPERVRFAGTEAGMAPGNRIRATVTEIVFAGERRRYLCRCDNGSSIVVKEPAGAMTIRRAEGERVELVWPSVDTVVV